MDDFLDNKHLEMAGIEPEANSGENNETQQVQQQDTNTQGGESQQAQQPAQAQDQKQSQAGKTSDSSAKDGGQQQGKKPEGQNTGDPELKPGDIRLQDGTIVRAGAERRHYENARVLKTEVGVLKNDLNTANQRLQNLQGRYDTLESTVKAIGLEDAQSVSSAVRLYKDLASNPVQTMTKLLAELQAKGYSFEGIGGQVDSLAIQSLLDERLGPQNNQQQQTPEQLAQQAQEEAAQEALQFLQQFPDARIHEDAIAAILDNEFKQGRQPSLRQVYFQLRTNAVNSGFDWDKPLGPQILARQQQAQQQQQSPQQQQKPIGGRPGVVEQHSEHIDPLKSGNGDRTDDIILAAMAENGYNYKR